MPQGGFKEIAGPAGIASAAGNLDDSWLLRTSCKAGCTYCGADVRKPMVDPTGQSSIILMNSSSEINPSPEVSTSWKTLSNFRMYFCFEACRNTEGHAT